MHKVRGLSDFEYVYVCMHACIYIYMYLHTYIYDYIEELTKIVLRIKFLYLVSSWMFQNCEMILLWTTKFHAAAPKPNPVRIFSWWVIHNVPKSEVESSKVDVCGIILQRRMCSKETE